MTVMKRCTKCGETKPVDCFNRDRSKHDGLYCRCKECCRAYNRSYREANWEKEKARSRAYWNANREGYRAYREAHREERLAYNRTYRKAHREEQRAYDGERRAMLGNPTQDRWNEITKKHATRSGRWSEAEDNYLATSTERIVDDALELGRTFNSVNCRIRDLRARGVILARDAS